MSKDGYQENFLGDDFNFDLPKIALEHESNIVKPTNANEDDGPQLHYPNYSVVMNRKTRQAFYSAGNANFNRNTGKGRDYQFDPQIDESLQLGNIYYKNLKGVENPYDRGHLTRRAAIAWGPTKEDADQASKESCFYTNLSLQHKNFNQDEWHALEEAIENANLDADNRFNILCGPVFSEPVRFITRA